LAARLSSGSRRSFHRPVVGVEKVAINVPLVGVVGGVACNHATSAQAALLVEIRHTDACHVLAWHVGAHFHHRGLVVLLPLTHCTPLSTVMFRSFGVLDQLTGVKSVVDY